MLFGDNLSQVQRDNEAWLRLKHEMGDQQIGILLARRAGREVVPAGSCTPDTIMNNARGIKGLLALVRGQLDAASPEQRRNLNEPLLDLVALGLTPEEAAICHDRMQSAGRTQG